jgi:hypothetical protein
MYRRVASRQDRPRDDQDIAQIDPGCSMLRQAQERNALSEDEATELGVRAVREARRGSR